MRRLRSTDWVRHRCCHWLPTYFEIFLPSAPIFLAYLPVQSMKIAPLGLAGGRSYDRTNSLRTPTMKESQRLREKTTSSVFVSTRSNAVHAQFH